MKSSKAQRKEAKWPERNRAERAQVYAQRFMAALDLRCDIKMDILNRVILMLKKAERKELRELHAMNDARDLLGQARLRRVSLQKKPREIPKQ